MILKEITINNFGIYNGKNRFNLAPRSKTYGQKPVILIGGKNGTGKTTILQSIKICLYGKLSLGSRISQNEYSSYLKQKFNKFTQSIKGVKKAFVEIVFDFTRIGDSFEFRIKRTWESKGDRIKESIEIWRNNIKVEDIEEDQKNEYINELIPFEIFELFFFDGEKINSLFNINQHNTILKDNFESLLRLDIVQRLNDDLNIYLGNQQKKFDINRTKKTIDELQNELDKSKENIRENRTKIASLKTKKIRIENEIAAENRKLSSQGGSFAKKREKFLLQEAELNNRIYDLADEIKNICKTKLPFSLIPSLGEKLINQLMKEVELSIWESSNDQFLKNSKIIINEISKMEFVEKYRINNDDRNEISTKIYSIISEILEKKPLELESLKKIHNLSIMDSQNVISTIQEISITKKSYLAKNLELEKLHKKREFIRTNLKRVPSDELLKNSINIINKLSQEKGQLEQLISNSQIEVDSIGLKVEEIEKQIVNSKKELRKMEKENRKIDLALKVQEVLKEYQDEIKESKLRALEIELLRYFKIICGKKDIIQRVSIDKDKFEIKIFDEEHSGQEKLFSLETNDKLNHEQLSAGEKQLFIFSLIWALIRMSNRKIMFMIDTPLGRLDSTHRINIVKEFFPKISHQVIILSTDTEFNKNLTEELEPHISHTYLLDYDKQKKKVEIKKDYFWNINIKEDFSENEIFDMEVKT